MYSQNDEERFLAEFFAGHTGAFLDIGAYDGISISNTRRLLELGWRGVLVEPNPINFCKLMANTAPYYSHTQMILAAVEAVAGLRTFYMDDTPDRGWAGTINPELLKAGSVMKPSEAKVYIPTISIEALCPFGPYDFINIDAEWEDFEIVKTMPEPMLANCKLLCVEPRGLEERAVMKAWLAGHGMIVAHETPENLLLKHE